MAGVSLNDLIGGIYDAAIAPDRWHEAIESIRVRYRFQIAMMGILKMPGARPLVQVACNVPAPYLHSLPELAEGIPELWGGTAGMARLPLELPLVHSRVEGYEKKDTNRYYLEWARPQGLEDQVVIVLMNDAHANATLGLGMHVSREPVSADELAELAMLAPHLRRAATVSRLLDASVSAGATFAGALDAIRAGVVIVDADLAILHANGSAGRMLAAADPIRRDGGRLEITRPLAPGQLERAVEAAARDEASIGRRGLGLPARRADGSTVALHIMPIGGRAARAGLPTRAAAAVFVSAETTADEAAISAIAAIHGLTAAETRVFAEVIAGSSTARIATALGIAPSTLRSHLHQVFAKTGCRRRADLLQLAARFAVTP